MLLLEAVVEVAAVAAVVAVAERAMAQTPWACLEAELLASLLAAASRLPFALRASELRV